MHTLAGMIVFFVGYFLTFYIFQPLAFWLSAEIQRTTGVSWLPLLIIFLTTGSSGFNGVLFSTCTVPKAQANFIFYTAAVASVFPLLVLSDPASPPWWVTILNSGALAGGALIAKHLYGNLSREA